MNKECKDNKKIEEEQPLKGQATEAIDDNEKTKERGIEGKNLEKEKREIEDRYIRLQAEFDNYRKRASRDRIEFVKFANEGLIIELLEILDNFERGIKAAELKKDFDLLHQGVDMISKQLHVLLENKGLVRIKSVGEKFNPHHHEAVEVIDGDKEEDSISEEMQAGYLLNGKIIRPSRVKVVKGKCNDVSQKENDKQEEDDSNQEPKKEEKAI